VLDGGEEGCQVDVGAHVEVGIVPMAGNRRNACAASSWTDR
jgi:hypothetical protein